MRIGKVRRRTLTRIQQDGAHTIKLLRRTRARCTGERTNSSRIDLLLPLRVQSKTPHPIASIYPVIRFNHRNIAFLSSSRSTPKMLTPRDKHNTQSALRRELLYRLTGTLLRSLIVRIKNLHRRITQSQTVLRNTSTLSIQTPRRPLSIITKSSNNTNNRLTTRRRKRNSLLNRHRRRRVRTRTKRQRLRSHSAHAIPDPHHRKAKQHTQTDTPHHGAPSEPPALAVVRT